MTFTEIYSKNYKTILGYLINKLNDFHLAEDLTQETFIKVFNYDENLIDEATVLPWLITIANNIISDHYRKHKDVMKYEDDMTKYDRYLTDDNLALTNDETFDYIVSLIPEEKYRKIIILRLKDEMSYREISSYLGESESTLRVWMHRGIDWLRKNKHDVLIKFL